MCCRICVRACVRACMCCVRVDTDCNGKEKARLLVRLVVILLRGLSILQDKISDSFAFHC